MNTTTLNDGRTIPSIGYGVYQVPSEDTEQLVATALDVGYRSIDTAALYGNEAGVGRAVLASCVPRGDVFVTSKVWNDDQGYDTTLRAFERSLAATGLEYLDMYLIHWPLAKEGKFVDTFRALQKLKADGMIRSIGVSNFTRSHLEQLIDATSEVPAVNQVELHPLLAQNELREFHDSVGIVTEAWGPLGQGSTMSIPEITTIAESLDKTAAQVVLRWHLQRGTVVIPKSATPARIASNIDVFDFSLSVDQMAVVDSLNTGERLGADPDVMW
jgi:2,5-diketo-D-gluconate reductase A